MSDFLPPPLGGSFVVSGVRCAVLIRRTRATTIGAVSPVEAATSGDERRRAATSGDGGVARATPALPSVLVPCRALDRHLLSPGLVRPLDSARSSAVPERCPLCIRLDRKDLR